MFRPRVEGKFIFVGDEKLYIKGVTYGAFKPDKDGNEYQNLEIIDRDLAMMAANGINTVRIPHTTPPRSLLDIAHKHNLRVMVGLSAEQYVGYLIDKKDAPDIESIIRAKVRICAGHPALLCYAIGNEIPASIARWLGAKKIERYLKKVYRAIKAEDPDGIVTYVNYPTTEYLQLPFLDLVSFNVYLESEERLGAYLARLQNMAGDRPLLMSEVGLDAIRNGEETQARVMEWQIRKSFAAGCVGCVIFSWTDEWYRGGAEVDDWAFGLTTEAREPKPALNVVRQAFSEVPFKADINWPGISIVVCSYNGARTIRDTLEAIQKLDYPDFEVIVVNDGSTDSTKAIAEDYNVRLISTENRGLSSARNTGMEMATGEIVAYLDDDAYPDTHWLKYLAHTFMTTDYVGLGGPNLSPSGDGEMAACVDNSPGNPMCILLSDSEAEHVAGCNMAIRKSYLQAIDGFDTWFRVAGDDVDVCWRLQECGWKLGYSPAALVWHHRRNSLSTYWKQQVGYGKSEALLEKKWPTKYNQLGHISWGGRVYGAGLTRNLQFKRWRIYHGMWGSAPFQSIHENSPSLLASLSLMPEWYLVILVLLLLSALGIVWKPLLITIVFLIPAVSLPVIQAGLSSFHASFDDSYQKHEIFKMRLKTLFLHLFQPLARLYGRIKNGLTPWRWQSKFIFSLPIPQSSIVWSEFWQVPEKRLASLETALRQKGASVVRGGDCDRWDLEVRGGLFGAVRILMAVEDHGSGTQLVRFRAWPQLYFLPLCLALLFALLAFGAAIEHVWIAAGLLGFCSLWFMIQKLRYCGAAMAHYSYALQETVK